MKSEGQLFQYIPHLTVSTLEGRFVSESSSSSNATPSTHHILFIIAGYWGITWELLRHLSCLRFYDCCKKKKKGTKLEINI